MPGARRRWGALSVLAALAVSVVIAPPIDGAMATADPVVARCLAGSPVTQTGTPLVSRPMVAAVTGGPLELSIPIGATASERVNPGGTVTTITSATLDLEGVAEALLVERVRPAIAAAGYPQLAAGAWVLLDLDDTTFIQTLPTGMTPVGAVGVDGGTVGATASWTGGAVTTRLGSLHADTRTPGDPVTVATGWRAADDGTAAPRSLVLHPPSLSFDAHITVGLSFAGSPLTGGVAAPWSCRPSDGDRALATTLVQSEPVPATSAPPLPAPGATTTTSAPATTAPPTTWADGPSTRPGDCPSPDLDRYGGWAPIQLEATGRFRVAPVEGRSWLVDPDGHPFWSSGVNHVTFEGTPDRNGVALYRDSALARYGSREAWGDAQLARLPEWGYNTLGAWSDTEILGRSPYALLLGVTSQDSSTGRMEDLWAPAWPAGVRATVDRAVAAHGDDPMLIGYWLDNELHWGPDWRPLHLFDDYLDRGAAAPGKQLMLDWLQERYPDFASFTDDFATSAASWDDLRDPSTAVARPGAADRAGATRAAWVGVVAERYFSITDDALTTADPGHLNLGPRFIAQTTGRPVLEAAARHVDVASFNLYAIDAALLPGLRNADPTYLPTDGGLAAQHALMGTPILISEWGFRAADSGLPNTWPPLFPTLDTQGQRAGAYEAFVRTLLGTTWVVGQHWFEHADEPAAGRFDGEDSNFGLVDGHDDPYEQIVSISKAMHDCAYARLRAGPSSTSTSSTTSTTSTSAASSVTTAVPADRIGPAAVEPTPAGPAQPVRAAATFTG